MGDGRKNGQHNILKEEWVGRRRLLMGVSRRNRFTVMIQTPNRAANQVQFYGSYIEAEAAFYNWRAEMLRQLAIDALGVEP